MYLDITYFGYGVGLVMAGWFFGMVIAVVFKALRSVWYFSFLFFFLIISVSESQAVVSTYDCYTLSTVFITHENKSNDKLQVNDSVTSVNGILQQSFSCKGNITVGCSSGDYVVSLIPIEKNSPIQIYEYPLLVSLFVGALTGIAFVLAFKWGEL